MNGKPYLEFREDGTFRVLHITDLQEGVRPKKDTLRLLNALLDTAKPDLVILTGDQLKGYSPAFRLLGKESVQNTLHILAEPMEKRAIPYAVTFGNHDAQCGLSNEEQAAVYRSCPYCICPAEEQAAGTFYLKIRNSSGAETLLSDRQRQSDCTWAVCAACTSSPGLVKRETFPGSGSIHDISAYPVTGVQEMQKCCPEGTHLFSGSKCR